MPKRKTHHVLKSPDGGWDVKKGGASRKSGHFSTKREAEAYGRKISKSLGSELVIHGKDGKIQRSDSHGKSQNFPKGRK